MHEVENDARAYTHSVQFKDPFLLSHGLGVSSYFRQYSLHYTFFTTAIDPPEANDITLPRRLRVTDEMYTIMQEGNSSRGDKHQGDYGEKGVK